MLRKVLVPLVAGLLLAAHGRAQNWPEEWSRPFEPVHIVGNLYYVGTYDLGVYLITTPEGHFLVNTGLKDSVEPIRKNIEKVGFKLEDVKILLEMQAHFDHVAGLAEIKEATGAKVYATDGDKGLLEHGSNFEPVQVDKVIENKDVIGLGGITLTVLETPGHTRGSTSFLLDVVERGKTYKVIIANMGTVIPGMNLIDDPHYPEIADDFRTTFERQRDQAVDIWVAAHASQFGLHRKYKPGDEYDPERFVDPVGYQNAVSRHEKMFQDKLTEQRKAR